MQLWSCCFCELISPACQVWVNSFLLCPLNENVLAVANNPTSPPSHTLGVSSSPTESLYALVMLCPSPGLNSGNTLCCFLFPYTLYPFVFQDFYSLLFLCQNLSLKLGGLFQSKRDFSTQMRIKDSLLVDVWSSSAGFLNAFFWKLTSSPRTVLRLLSKGRWQKQVV